MNKKAILTIQQYYDAFNQSSMDDFFALMTDDVVHEINQGGKEVGKDPFRRFMDKMNHSYKEKAVELEIFANEAGTRAACEFFIEGRYLATDQGLPEAKGQEYRLRCGAFFELKEGKIARITNYYNLNEWLDQVR